MTNWDKVKENISISTLRYKIIEEENPTYELCEEIEKIRGRCVNDCETCLNWLKQEYEEPKQPVLTDKEREYLSNVIKPFRDRIKYVMKEETRIEEWISITMETWYNLEIEDYLILPNFQTGTMYKGMDTARFYTLEELGL